MSYTLIGSPRSPFVRICRMLFIKNKVPFEFQALNFVDDAHDAAKLAQETPINKVPILIDGDQKIFDSRVIINHLTQKHHWSKLSLDEENIVSAIYSCLDTGVILFLMQRDGFDINGPGFFLARNRARIPNNLEYIKSWARTLNPSRAEDWNYPAMSLYSFLYWGEKRGIFKIDPYPELQKFMKAFENAPGVQETSF